MTARRFAPSGRVTFYRLTASLPLEVSFASVTYSLALHSAESAGRHELMAHDSGRGAWWRIGPAYHAEALLPEAVFTAGIPVQTDTVGGTIMRRLVNEGRAEVVLPPADDPAERCPQATRPLYDGEEARARFLVSPWATASKVAGF